MCNVVWDRALGYLQRARVLAHAPAEPLEPAGPFPQPVAWRLSFTEGTLRLALGEAALAAERLDEALAWDRSAEALNNLGVARFELGEADVARRLFEEALALFPAYLDAQTNLAAAEPQALTSHPLRRLPSRHEYRSVTAA